MTVADLNLSQAAVAFGGTLLYPDCRFRSVSTDTRTIEEGDLFVALRGEHYDAHEFLESAALHACGLVVEKPDKRLNLPQWVVPDTTVALGQLASLARKRFSGRVVAVTGSAGKTTAKEMIASILRRKGRVHATRGNLNNQIGVPLTLMRLSPRDEFAVIEMGASGPGEIGYLCQIARPDIGLITNVLPAHIEGFGSVAAVADAKGEIYRELPAAGTAVLNLDEPWVSDWRRYLSCQHSLTFSTGREDAQFMARDAAPDDNGCYGFTLVTPQGEIPVQLAVSGRHNLGNALAAAACASAAGADLAQIRAGLEAVQPVAGRMQSRTGINGVRVIDDSYNANPGSVKAAIDTLGHFQGRHILVLGDMGELGDDEASLHAEVGAYAREHNVDLLIAVGTLGLHTVEAFGEGSRHFADKAALGAWLKNYLEDADSEKETTVLVKGSRSAGMEDVVKSICEGDL